MSDNGRIDTAIQPPHSVEAENAVLGSILINPDALIDVAAFLDPCDFYIVRNGWIYEAMQAITAREEAIDYLTVVEELRQRGQLEDIGGAAYITYLINHTPSMLYTGTYGHIVERTAIRRRMLNAASEIAKLAHQEDADIDSVVAQGERVMLGVGARRAMLSYMPVDLLAGRALDRMDAARAGVVTGLETGYPDLDGLLGGLQPSNLLILAGRPGMGKTSEALSIAQNIDTRFRKDGDKRRILIVSMEMSADEVTDRCLAMRSGVSTRQQKDGKLTDEEYAAYVDAVAWQAKSQIIVLDPPTITPAQLRAQAVRIHAKTPLALVIIDYVGLMNAGIKTDRRSDEVGYISRQTKQLARELDVPVLLLSQLNRAVESRQDKRPLLSDLRESGDLEQDANVVMFIYRDEVYNENTERPNQADLIIAKHRNGPTGTVSQFFKKEITRFENLRKFKLDLGAYDPAHDPVRAAREVAT